MSPTRARRSSRTAHLSQVVEQSSVPRTRRHATFFIQVVLPMRKSDDLFRARPRGGRISSEAQVITAHVQCDYGSVEPREHTQGGDDDPARGLVEDRSEKRG